jgi:hypothetical protein
MELATNKQHAQYVGSEIFWGVRGFIDFQR